MPALGRILKVTRHRGREKVVSLPVNQQEKPNYYNSSFSDFNDDESINSIDVPIHIKEFHGPLYYQSQSIRLDESDECKTRRVSFHLDNEVHHYQTSNEDAEHSTLYYSSRDYKQFQEEAHLENLKSRSEEKQKLNDRIVDEETEELIRRVASQFCLKIQ
jgi:hypothetical protein